MGPVAWWRVLDIVGRLAEAGWRRRGSELRPTPETAAWGLRTLETRLIGVVVGALQKAFDHDHARLDLEREQLDLQLAQIDAERARAEAALRLELRRHAAERALAHIRLTMVMGALIWLASALLVVWLPGAAGPAPRVLLGIGWVGLVGSLASGFLAHNRVDTWLADERPQGSLDATHARALSLMQLLLLIGLTFVAAGLLAAL